MRVLLLSVNPKFSLFLKLCTSLGGEIPDLVNFGKNAEDDKRVEFVSDIFLSGRIPR